MAKPPVLRILQPQSGESLPVQGVPAVAPTSYFLLASGRAFGVRALVATLTDRDTPRNVYPGRVVKTGMHWGVVFDGLPLPAPTNYLLTVAQNDQPSGNLHVSVEFRAVPAGGAWGGNIPISAPAANATLCPSFTAFGSNGPSGNTTGAVMQINVGGSWNTVATGTFIDPGIAGMWSYQFTNVPDNEGYQLLVSGPAPPGGGAHDSGTVGGLTVDSNACNATSA